MTAQTKTVIKSYFETGDRPTQGQFADFVDSYQDADATLGAFTSASGGFIVKSSAAGVQTRGIDGTANEITVTDSVGSAGNPTISLPAAISLAGKTLTGGTIVSAALTSPAMTGVPTAPTAALATNTTQLATTAFVASALAALTTITTAGTYTPVLTNSTNITSSTAYVCRWTRVGNVVNVTGPLDATPTSAALAMVTLTIPVSSNLANDQLNGVGATTVGTAGAIIGNAGSDRAELRFTAPNTAAAAWSLNFSYPVV